MRHLVGGDPPNNDGYFRPVEVIAPPGTIVYPALPASVAARGLTGFRLADALFGALAQIAPNRVFACEAGGDTGVSFGASRGGAELALRKRSEMRSCQRGDLTV